MSASIVACITLTQDDTDVCINAVKSVVEWVDSVLIIDTGPAALRRDVRQDLPTPHEFADLLGELNYPVQYTYIDWGPGGDHALVHNEAASRLGPYYDWFYWIDSDEFCTLELAADYKRLADEAKPEVVTIAANLLTLYPDQQHYAVRYSRILSHGRFYRPRQIEWTGAWHEHQHYHGERLNLYNRYHGHLRQMLVNRCRRQHGHGPEGWADLLDNGVGEVKDIPATWLPLEIPEEDQID